jgi:hypothetical protein
MVSSPQQEVSLLSSASRFECGGEFPLYITELRHWIESRNFAGFEPFDLLNSPFLQHKYAQQVPINYLLIQLGKHFPGTRLRQFLRVPPSQNPKALGLILSAYCDLTRQGEDCIRLMQAIKDLLKRLRSPNEQECCWGYDWNYVSLRGARLPAFSMNAIATTFCAESLLDLAELAGDDEALAMSQSAARALVTRLHRSVDEPNALCFSYTPKNRTRIYNSSALTAAFLARIGKKEKDATYLDLARRAMRYLGSVQRADGSWFYGADRRQRWIDSFHTGYNLCAMLRYRGLSGDKSVDLVIEKGYAFYHRHFFLKDGTAKYASTRTYPIDIHACAHAIVCFVNFAQIDESALDKAKLIARWTMRHMRGSDGAYYFQRHRWWINTTPYMRWGQAWMLHALARLQLGICAAKAG